METNNPTTINEVDNYGFPLEMTIFSLPPWWSQKMKWTFTVSIPLSFTRGGCGSTPTRAGLSCVTKQVGGLKVELLFPLNTLEPGQNPLHVLAILVCQKPKTQNELLQLSMFLTALAKNNQRILSHITELVKGQREKISIDEKFSLREKTRRVRGRRKDISGSSGLRRKPYSKMPLMYSETVLNETRFHSPNQRSVIVSNTNPHSMSQEITQNCDHGHGVQSSDPMAPCLYHLPNSRSTFNSQAMKIGSRLNQQHSVAQFSEQSASNNFVVHGRNPTMLMHHNNPQQIQNPQNNLTPYLQYSSQNEWNASSLNPTLNSLNQTEGLIQRTTNGNFNQHEFIGRNPHNQSECRSSYMNSGSCFERLPTYEESLSMNYQTMQNNSTPNLLGFNNQTSEFHVPTKPNYMNTTTSTPWNNSHVHNSNYQTCPVGVNQTTTQSNNSAPIYNQRPTAFESSHYNPFCYQLQSSQNFHTTVPKLQTVNCNFQPNTHYPTANNNWCPSSNLAESFNYQVPNPTQYVWNNTDCTWKQGNNRYQNDYGNSRLPTATHSINFNPEISKITTSSSSNLTVPIHTLPSNAPALVNLNNEIANNIFSSGNSVYQTLVTSSTTPNNGQNKNRSTDTELSDIDNVIELIDLTTKSFISQDPIKVEPVKSDSTSANNEVQANLNTTPHKNKLSEEQIKQNKQIHSVISEALCFSDGSESSDKIVIDDKWMKENALDSPDSSLPNLGTVLGPECVENDAEAAVTPEKSILRDSLTGN